jgi:hypothetical protein
MAEDLDAQLELELSRGVLGSSSAAAAGPLARSPPPAQPLVGQRKAAKTVEREDEDEAEEIEDEEYEDDEFDEHSGSLEQRAERTRSDDAAHEAQADDRAFLGESNDVPAEEADDLDYVIAEDI